MEAFIESLVKKSTRKSYRYGIKSFEKWYKKPIEDLLKEEDPSKTVERFFVFLKQTYAQNTCRVRVNPVVQYLKYNNITVNLRKGLGIYRSTITTRDHLLQVQEAREMFKVGSLEEKVMVKTWLLGLRIADASRFEWEQFNYSSRDEMIEVLVHTRKEEIVAHVFLDKEFQELLTKHIRNLDKENQYLFQSEKGGRLSEKQLLRRLQSLQKKAGVKAKGSFNWHIGRKLFLRTCAELGVNQWNAKLMCGKAVDKSILTYINGVSLKKDAERISKALSMTEVVNHTSERLKDALRTLEKENRIQRTRIKELQDNIAELDGRLAERDRELAELEAKLKTDINKNQVEIAKIKALLEKAN